MFKNLIQAVADLLKFFTVGIWQKKTYKSPFVNWFVNQAKVFIFTIRNYADDSLNVRSAALTFFSVMSIVPVAAVAFGVAKAAGLDTWLKEYLYDNFGQYSEMLDKLMGFADSMLARTRGGVIAGVGVFVLFWSIVKVFGNVERAFNHIWDVKKQRSYARKVTDYLAVAILAPIIIGMSISLTFNVEKYIYELLDGSFFLPIVRFVMNLLPFVFAWILLTVLYCLIPNTRVRFASGFKAGIIAGTVFYAFQILYVYFQSSMNSYNAIYGSFAAIPLFLIWLQTSWQIVLFGAELSFAYQNIDKYEMERESFDISYEYRKKVLVVVMHHIVVRFVEGKPLMGSEKIARDLNIPVRIVRDVLFDAENAGLIVAVVNEKKAKTMSYLPGRDIHEMTVAGVIAAVENTGRQRFTSSETKEFKAVSALVDRFDELVMASDANVPLINIR